MLTKVWFCFFVIYETKLYAKQSIKRIVSFSVIPFFCFNEVFYLCKFIKQRLSRWALFGPELDIHHFWPFLLFWSVCLQHPWLHPTENPRD